jgi:hypothetical protein
VLVARAPTPVVAVDDGIPQHRGSARFKVVMEADFEQGNSRINLEADFEQGNSRINLVIILVFCQIKVIASCLVYL